jgi:predicted metal-binding protein
MTEYKDNFSEASKEQQDKSAFICENCKTKYNKQQVEEKGNTCCGRTVKELLQESFGA